MLWLLDWKAAMFELILLKESKKSVQLLCVDSNLHLISSNEL
jgi:hypothetical protein